MSIDRRRIGVKYLELRLGLHRVTITKWYGEGRFPRPHFLGGHRRWWLDEILAWEEANTATERPRRAPAKA